MFCLFDQQLKAEVAMSINPRFLMVGEDTSMPRESSMSSEVNTFALCRPPASTLARL
jgi:hypothetical protein